MSIVFRIRSVHERPTRGASSAVTQRHSHRKDQSDWRRMERHARRQEEAVSGGCRNRPGAVQWGVQIVQTIGGCWSSLRESMISCATTSEDGLRWKPKFKQTFNTVTFEIVIVLKNITVPIFIFFCIMFIFKTYNSSFKVTGILSF